MKNLIEYLKKNRYSDSRYYVKDHYNNVIKLINYCCDMDITLENIINIDTFNIDTFLRELNQIFESRMNLLDNSKTGLIHISEQLKKKMYDIYGGQCLYCARQLAKTELYPILIKRRKVWIGNLLYLCRKHHKMIFNKNADKVYQKIEIDKLKHLYMSIGYNKDEIDYLIGLPLKTKI